MYPIYGVQNSLYNGSFSRIKNTISGFPICYGGERAISRKKSLKIGNSKRQKNQKL